MGPGSSINDETGKLLNILASKIKKPLVLDADALKQVKPQIIKNREDVILTPHIFEFKSFFGKGVKLDLDSYDFAEVDKNISEFQQVVKEINGAVVVKGAVDLVIQKNKFKLNKSWSENPKTCNFSQYPKGRDNGKVQQNIIQFPKYSASA